MLYEQGASGEAARAAITQAGGKIVSENAQIGAATVRATDASFAGEVARSAAIVGATSDRAIGKAPRDVVKRDAIENGDGATASGLRAKRGIPGADPLASLQ